MNASKKILSLTGCAMLLFALHTYSQWSTDPTINTPVCTTSGSQQFYPQMVPDGSGGAIITWMETTIDFSSSRIYAQHISSTGMRLWAAAGVDVSGASGELTIPQIVSDGNGGAIISWINNMGGTLRHYVQKISATGQIQWNPSGVEVCPATVTQVFYYQLISDNVGGAILLWDDTRSVQNQVYAQHISANGNLLWPVNGLACTPLFTNRSSYDAVADSTGGLILCWTLTTGIQSRNDVFVQHISANGILQWGPAGTNICNAVSDQLYCKIAKDSLDNIIVIWQDFRLDPVMSQLYGQRVSHDGTIKWQPDGILLGDSIVPASTIAKIVTDTSRGAIISWLDDFSQGQSTTAHLFALRIDSTGNNVWAKKEIATWTDLQVPVDFELVADFKGGAFISWISPTSTGSTFEIYDLFAQHVLPNGFLQWPLTGQVVSSAPMTQSYQQMVCDSNGVAILAWSDLRNMADYDLYATRLPASSTLPVTWLNFSGTIRESAVYLNWETSNEINNSGFTIQRSHNGISFDSIGFIPGSNLVQDICAYSFTDLYPRSGPNYYRLQQKDIDGRISFSRIILLDIGLKIPLSVYPNPASEYITVRGTNAGGRITIYSADGKKYREVRSSGDDVKIDIREIPNGIYFLQVIEDNNSHSFLLAVAD